jgi:Bacterial aa3 type cytochrome c oxidase subunit IV
MPVFGCFAELRSGTGVAKSSAAIGGFRGSAMATKTDDIPQMDYAEHERTFRGFALFTEIAVVHVLCLVLVITIWGVKHSGGWALFGFLLTLVATLIGAFSPALAWRPLAPVLVFLLLLLALL